MAYAAFTGCEFAVYFLGQLYAIPRGQDDDTQSDIKVFTTFCIYLSVPG